MRPLYLLASGGVVAAVAAAVLGIRKATATKNTVLEAVGGDAQQAKAASDKAQAAKTPADVKAAASQVQAAAEALPSTSPDVIAEAGKAVAAAEAAKTSVEVKAAADQVQAVAAKMTGNVTVDINATGYWPFSATASEQQMEGGVTGAAAWNGRRVVDPATGKRILLHTVEEYLAGKVPYFSISGDPQAWPFGQLVQIAWFGGKTILGRVVDTGSHFTGVHKTYRAAGREPLDCCVASKSTKVLEKTTATVIRGDHFDKAGRDLVASKFKGQDVTVGALFMLGAKTLPLVDCVDRGAAFARGHVVSSNGRERWTDAASGIYEDA